MPPVATQEELDLVRDVISGDAGASGTLVRRYCSQVYNIALRDFRLERSLADDVYQDFCERLLDNDYRVLRHWQGKQPLSGYFRTIIRNLILDHLRGNRRNPTEELAENPPDDPDADPAELTSRRGLIDCIRHALQTLREKDRSLITLRHWREHSYAEIAAILRITVNNVGVALLRAERRLAELVEARCREWL